MVSGWGERSDKGFVIAALIVRSKFFAVETDFYSLRLFFSSLWATSYCDVFARITDVELVLLGGGLQTVDERECEY